MKDWMAVGWMLVPEELVWLADPCATLDPLPCPFRGIEHLLDEFHPV